MVHLLINIPWSHCSHLAAPSTRLDERRTEKQGHGECDPRDPRPGLPGNESIGPGDL